MTKYGNKSSVDFINNLSFDYIETYTFQRGEQYEEINKLEQNEYNKLEQRKIKKNDLNQSEELRFNELKGLVKHKQYILNDKGKLHPYCKKTNTFKHDDQQVIELIKILKTEIINVYDWMCAPIYRDAIIFYDKKGEIISSLNICLSCSYIQTSKDIYIDADESTYGLLKHFFKKIGHNVE